MFLFDGELIRNIEDQQTRDCFYRLTEALEGALLLRSDIRLIEIDLDSAKTNYKYGHNFGFIPPDCIVLSCSAGSITINFANFDDTNIDFTTTAAAKVRLLVGRFGDAT